jgi:hypothetical protein
MRNSLTDLLDRGALLRGAQTWNERATKPKSHDRRYRDNHPTTKPVATLLQLRSRADVFDRFVKYGLLAGHGDELRRDDWKMLRAKATNFARLVNLSGCSAEDSATCCKLSAALGPTKPFAMGPAGFFAAKRLRNLNNYANAEIFTRWMNE